MRYFAIVAILLLGVAGFAQDKTATVRTGQTYLDLNFSAADTINESETYYVEVDNFQHFPQMADVYVDIDTVSGGCGVEVVLQAKKFEGSSYESISDTVTWAGTADTTFTISTTTAARYRYYKLLFTADSTDQQSIISDVQFKFWDTGGDLSTASLSLTSNLTVTGTSTFTGAVTANGGITLGAGDDLIGSSTSDITFNTNKFTVAGATGNTVIAGTLGVTGASTFTGLVTANGGVTLGAGDDLIGSATSDITINTTAFTVAGATGNTSVGGTLGVTGATTATGVINANGGVAVTDSIEIDGIKLIVRLDTLCAVSGSDTLRLFPSRLFPSR